MKGKPRAIAVSVAGVSIGIAALSGCGTKKTPSTDPATTDAAATETTVTTSVAFDGAAPTIGTTPVETAAVVPLATLAPSILGLSTVEAANQNLWDAWRDDDRTRALLYANASAVDTLFATKWGPEVRNQGCGSASGILRCVYTVQKGARVVIVEPTTSGTFRVSRVQLVGELPTSNRLESDVVDDTVVVDASALETTTTIDIVLDPTNGGVAAPPDTSAANGDTNTPATAATAGSPSATAVATGVSAGAVPTVAGSSGSAGSAGSSGSSGVRRRVTTKRRVSTTRRRRVVTTTASANDGQSTPAPAPSPEPTPVPQPGPVQVRSRTVDTVAPG